MKHIRPFNESLRDKMISKSDEEISESLKLFLIELSKDREINKSNDFLMKIKRFLYKNDITGSGNLPSMDTLTQMFYDNVSEEVFVNTFFTIISKLSNNNFKNENIIFDEFKVLNEEITYAQLGLKEPDYKKHVKDHLHYILSNVIGVSEKDFRRSDILSDRIKDIFAHNPEIDEAVKRFEERKCRYEFCAEHIYEWFVKGTSIIKEI